MDKSSENRLNEYFDEVIFQLSKGNTIERLKRGIYYTEFERLKEWKSRFGYQFDICSNDHFIDHKPHFHFKKNDEIECRVFFDGTIYDCKGKGQLDKKVRKLLVIFYQKSKFKRFLLNFGIRKILSVKFNYFFRVQSLSLYITNKNPMLSI
jgi:hypothetical protein